LLLTTDIRRGVEEKIKDVKNSLALGSASDYSEYRYIVGYLAGLSDGADISVEILNRRLKIDNDEEDFK
jgi:hypothetical protein